ncbi:VOC family protein [Nesterenkonia rhizosphaerae]|uniref:VOC family protein n=1 Tax=Nesterenkonia rhizosphaerae TaxID=1348272 RepID=A0ABP9FTR0_9MICC
MPVQKHHAISYVEFAVKDLAATRAFYESAFGWEFNDYGPTYSGIKSPDGEGEIGGLDAGTAPQSGGPLVLLFSEDLDATVDAVRAAGGSITAEPYDFPGGRRFEFTDPSGNRLGVYAEA